jgi:hypothetical protein
MKTIKKFFITPSTIYDRKLFKQASAVALVAFLLLPLAIIGFIPAAAQEAADKADDELSTVEKQLLTLAAASRGTAAGYLKLIASARETLPLTGVAVTVAKLYNPATEEVFETGMDESGKEADLKALRAAEEQAYATRYGKLDPFLHDIVQSMRGTDKVKVALWLKHEDPNKLADPRAGEIDLTAQEVEELIARRGEQLRKATAEAVRPLRSYFIRKRIQIDEVSLLAPIVYATVRVRVLATLSQRADVQRIYFADNVNEDYMNIAAPTIRANDVWSEYGVSGEGVNVAIVEDSRVDFNNTCLVRNLGTRAPGDPNVDQHATATAGMVASNHLTLRGIAYGAGIYSANGTTYGDANMSAALDAGSANAHILNNSWGPGCGSDGSMNVHARHADYLVRFGWDTVVAAAGNNGSCLDPRIGCRPREEYVSGVATGYNVIAVGNFDDKGTLSRDDDVMHCTSSFRNPTSPRFDREKPEVAAPGTNISSLKLATPGFSCSAGDVGLGTSYSSPMVAGIASLLMSGRPSLKIYPEAVKALILAGAMHNLEGSDRLSERDGAGGVDALTSYQSAINGTYKWMSVTPSSFDSSGMITIDIGYLLAGQRLKAALVWDSNPSSDYSTDALKADLDLLVQGPGVSEWSASWDSSFEVADFTVPATGYYTIKIRKRRFDGAREYVAVAWNQKGLDFSPRP